MFSPLHGRRTGVVGPRVYDLNRLMKAQRTVERQNGTLAIGKQPVASSRERPGTIEYLHLSKLAVAYTVPKVELALTPCLAGLKKWAGDVRAALAPAPIESSPRGPLQLTNIGC